MRKRLMTVTALAAVWMARAAVAADTIAASGVEAESLSWQAMLRSGGWLMVVLALLSLLTVALIIYFLVVVRLRSVAPRFLHRELVERLRGGEIAEARKTCQYKPTPLSAVALVGIDYVRQADPPDPMLLKDVMEGEGARQAESIEGQIRFLLDIAVIAPMIGMLGTVFGMLRAFSAVALDIAKAKPMVLAAGVSQALVTTAFGLMVGIPAMIFFAMFRRRAATLTAQLEAASTDVMTALLSKRDV